jgi:pyruvate dehydrogenase E1 component alpha subunit
LVFFGDGAITRGTFHEVMNMAALWKLPLILVCENNGYAQYVSSKDTMVFDDIASLAQNYKMPGLCLDGNDIQAVYSQAKDAISNARNGLGPCLIELKTQRFQGHSSGDPQVYRSKSDVEALKKNRDPIAALEQVLLDKALLPNRESLLQQVEAEVNRAVAFALASPYPDDAEVGTDVYAEGVRHA